MLAQGREIPRVLAGRASSPELETVKRDYQLAFIENSRSALPPFAGPRSIAPSSLWAMFGAAANKEITAKQTQAEFYEIIVAMVGRNGAGT